MIWKKWFGREKERQQDLDPLHDLSLDKLQPGYLVDYDLTTWQVTARHRYDLGDGGGMIEWELRSGRQTRYLNMEEDDGAVWTWTRKIPLAQIDARLKQLIMEKGDPPERIDFDGDTYIMESYGGGQFYEHDRGEGIPFLFWDYETEDGEKVLTIEQWGDTEFEAAVGHYVEEYQFSHILPGAPS
ncbi:protein of unknown function [Desulfacinum hydrothermale DSM 13146]|uniref:DUF4178 domain-containing protein n=1 Tax=Desulfacinum hydrothermale DSM 13146 TaxID=1121390 RepID=A0A1W1XPU3_9BACT|nr:DUF4178 domain-containing protein [Desulfacinum hydrothermale]SMC25983.1 protein of unknown function [Desulfacinum hydrothermale DSM 13146]